jgi:Tfp pilus assembly protein PilN
MALRDINLIAADIMERRYLLRHLFLWCGGLLGVVVLMAGIHHYQSRVHDAARQDLAARSSLGATLTRVVDESKKEERELTLALGEQGQFGTLAARFRPYSAVIATVAEIMNGETWLQQLALETDQDRTLRVRLMGFSRSHEALGDFVQGLSQETLFTSVVLKLAQESEARALEASQVQFQVECTIAGR